MPLAVAEQRTPAIDAVYAEDSAIAAWWATYVECTSAFTRLLRERALTPAGIDVARVMLDEILLDMEEIPPSLEVRDRSVRLLSRYPLRAADALQLAAGLEWAGDRPFGLGFVCLDGRLRGAAQAEGFIILP